MTTHHITADRLVESAIKDRTSNDVRVKATPIFSISCANA